MSELAVPFIGSAFEFAQAAQPVKWVVQGMLPEQSLVFVAGLPKFARKSWICTHLGLCVAQGIPFIGHKTQPRGVVYFYLEDGRLRVAQRMKAFGVTNPKLKFKCAVIFDAMTYYQEFDLLAESKDPLLIIFDTFSKLEIYNGMVDENSSLQTTMILEKLRRLCHEQGHTIIVVHHHRKDGAGKRGSGAQDGSSDGWWDIVAHGEDKKLITGTLRDGRDFSVGVDMRIGGTEDAPVIERFDAYDPNLFSEETQTANSFASANGSAPGGGSGYKKRRKKPASEVLIDFLTSNPMAAGGQPWSKRALEDATGISRKQITNIMEMLGPDVIVQFSGNSKEAGIRLVSEAERQAQNKPRSAPVRHVEETPTVSHTTEFTGIELDGQEYEL